MTCVNLTLKLETERMQSTTHDGTKLPLPSFLYARDRAKEEEEEEQREMYVRLRSDMTKCIVNYLRDNNTLRFVYNRS